MNRQQRRNQEKKQERKIINKYNRIKEEMKKEATDVATILMFYISILVLRDKYGFGKKRLGDFMDHVTDLLEALQEDRLTFIDIRDAIKEETGYEIPVPDRKYI